MIIYNNYWYYILRHMRPDLFKYEDICDSGYEFGPDEPPTSVMF